MSKPFKIPCDTPTGMSFASLKRTQNESFREGILWAANRARQLDELLASQNLKATPALIAALLEDMAEEAALYEEPECTCGREQHGNAYLR